MDATPMTPSAGPEQQELPASLALMGTFMAAQVELGMGIQEAHEREVAAHNRTRGQLRYTQLDVERLRKYNLDLLAHREQVRSAMHGEEEPPEDGDVLAEARELWRVKRELERELLQAKELLEAASGQTSRWKRHRAMFQDRVSLLLGMPQPEGDAADLLPEQTPDNPWGIDQAEPELGQEYDRRPAEEDNGESHP